jgi:TolA-binding protein
MNEPSEAFDWSSLGDAPLPGELEDDALLSAVLDQHATAEEEGSRAPGWVRPATAVVLLIAAAVLLLVFAPSFRTALLGDEDAGSIAPDVETPTPESAIERREAPPRKATQGHASAPQPAVVPPPEPEPAPDVEEADTPAPDAAAARPRPRPPASSPDTLLREAQDAFAAKDTAGARRKYQALIRQHPRSAEARAARVSLGRIELAGGRARRALTLFDRYLDSAGGNLRREAELGRIEALGKLGRPDAERVAIERFLAKHPSTVHAQRLRTRLESLR